ncbi:hypothetical protein BRD05_00785 [Halobacteriales archaeon QS_9_70_65]|nr:MAG: hypothetical protein BRD05_00785 [Halobacteriales archaeon QS_9_70_65]
MTVAERLDDDRTLVYTAAVANTLLLSTLLYGALFDRSPTLYWAFPVVWATVGTWAALRTPRPPAPTRTRLVAGAVAGGYFLVLAAAGGLIGPGGEPTPGLSVQLTELPPGWNPAVFYGGELFRVAVVPYTAFGYAVLSYLVYLTAIEAKGAVAGGVLGLFSCVSCTLPVIASVVGGFVGGGTALAAAASAQTYALGTVVFVVTVLLLTLRPGLPGR